MILKKMNSNNLNKAVGLLAGLCYKILFCCFLDVGTGFRKSFFSRVLNKRNVKIGNDFDLKFGGSISGAKFVSGDNVSIGMGSHIIGDVSMGSNIRVAQNVVIVSDYYGLSGKESFLSQPGYSKGRIEIGDEVWIGANSIILSGVTIGKGVCVGAGSVVGKSVPDYAIVAGNPAKIIRFRE